MADTYEEEELTRNQAGSQSSPQNFHIPPTLAAHFPPFPAPSHPTDLLIPFSSGSTSNLYRTIVKKPNPISIEINEELHSNAADVALQFAAELRVYRKVGKHSGFVAYLGCVENLGMVLEWVDGPTLLDVLRGPAPNTAAYKAMKEPHKNPSKKRRVVWHNQLVDALSHLHSLGLNHGDLSLLNIHVEMSTDSVKLIDFGRSVSVAGYPCQDLYMPQKKQLAPPKKEKSPPPMFNPGGAWANDRAGGEDRERGRQLDGYGRDGGRPKLFDRSTPIPRNPTIETQPPTPDLSRPINHATRLLHQHAPQGPSLGTHMPVTMSRSNRGRDPQNTSRPSSASPVQTRFHLSTSPMSPRTSTSQTDSGVYIDQDGTDNGYGYGSEQDDWMQVDNYGSSGPSEYSTRGPGGYPQRRASDDMYGTYGNYGPDRGRDRYNPDYYTPSPSRSRPASRRQSRSPSRYGSPAMYATHNGGSLHTYHPPKSRHMSRSPSRHHGPIPEQYATPQQYSYSSHHASPHPHPHSHSHHRHSQSYSHAPTPPGYPPGYHSGRPAPRPQPPPPQPKPEPIQPGSRPFCAPEILRAPSGSCIDSRTKMWVDPILADAYSFGIILVCMDLCVLVDIGNEAQKREDGKFPDLSKTTIFTEAIKGYVKPVTAGRERITSDKKMEVPKEDD